MFLGRPAGLCGADWHRGQSDRPQAAWRWMHGAEIAGDLMVGASMVTLVADRVSDIYELFTRRPAEVRLLCLSAHDRALTEGGLLSAHCDA